MPSSKLRTTTAKSSVNMRQKQKNAMIVKIVTSRCWVHLPPTLQNKKLIKPKPKKVKVTPSVANYKSGDKTALLLLGQIDAILEANSVVNGHSLSPCKNLKKQCEAVELAAEQQLHLLDVSLQTYKLIMACLSHLDKALAPANIDLAGLLLNMLNISFKSVPKDSDIKLANPSMSDPKGSLELLLTPIL
ncbi:hypothetical protein E4T56_gene13163 [Termitomyces sp. T112]|nr:hypothetical protein E4T56_gene13163 [Termitomyces sp. T112]KNZ75946.1 hypothetical protein J132_00694 [Termitomyces sp. J132]